MQSHPIIVQQPYVIASQQPAQVVAVKTTRWLGISQLVVGCLTTIGGIFAVSFLGNYWASYIGFAIWGGIWITVSGIFGVTSASNPSNRCLHWINMSFAIVSCCVTFIDFIVYAIVVGDFSQSRYNCFFSSCFHGTNGGALAIYSILLALAILEFGIALATSIYCCKFGCTGCCNEEVIIQGQPHVVPSSGYGYSSAVNPAAFSTVIPAASLPAYTSHDAGNYAPQGAYTSAGMTFTTQPMAMTYDQAHGKQDPPPEYTN